MVEINHSPPEVCLLFNGRYSILLTASGGGYSVVDGMDVTRWREGATRNCWGQYCYIRDLVDGSVWSAGRQPAGRCADEYQAELRPDRGVLRRRDGEIETSYVAVVYGAPPHTGRGGWTRYTGSAGWLYRVGLEAILGFRLRGNRLHIKPCIPPTWQGYELTYRYGSATYHVSVENRGSRCSGAEYRRETGIEWCHRSGG
jgi:cellobiose phosphorylase